MASDHAVHLGVRSRRGAARHDPILHLSSNHGHPQVAATAHSGQFKGAGIVAARPGKPVFAPPPKHGQAVAMRAPQGKPGAPPPQPVKGTQGYGQIIRRSCRWRRSDRRLQCTRPNHGLSLRGLGDIIAAMPARRMLSGQLSRSFPPAQRRNRHAKHVCRFANGNDPFHLVQNRTDSLRLHVYCSSPEGPRDLGITGPALQGCAER
jgi:hypothetical protein